MALYRGSVKVSGIGKGFNPQNEGVEGQFLKKTSTGYAYDDIPEITVDSELSPTSENPVQNKVITNALQNAGGSSDHLEVKAPVGELYQLTDTMFLQNTPTLANSTVEQKVGDTSTNTQIHIQRIASGIGSNELKLKLKKVGTPGDLSVQVMKGVQVTVTANVEAYWYGDSNNILATGSVSASSITTSRQEITVTLDDEVGGTEGELLDIVLSIPSVNASNYVVIACDSTQWSEGFSFVAVNGNTRTRSKLMPYCISDGFAQGLLCKVSDTTLELVDVIYNVQNGSVTLGGSKIQRLVDQTYPAGNIRSTLQMFTNNAYISCGDYNPYYSNQYLVARQSDGLKTSTNSYSGGSYKLYVQVQNTYSSSQTITYSCKLERLLGNISKPTSVWKGKLRGNNGLGIMDAITLFGVHSDGTWLEYNNS